MPVEAAVGNYSGDTYHQKAPERLINSSVLRYHIVSVHGRHLGNRRVNTKIRR